MSVLALINRVATGLVMVRYAAPTACPGTVARAQALVTVGPLVAALEDNGALAVDAAATVNGRCIAHKTPIKAIEFATFK